ncbi:hypothetical protein GE061_002376 [Apolygus lucorum]|uniref:Fanconi anemia group M protein n=1 Tax=Apolygus lucorum TaxID=248454 RepID=A0A8S9X7J5_APOLU|nr:hypothetical protein GE061_002376 [Apolygus lucorum]
MSLEYLLNDEEEDALLARVQEESLRHYRDFELPRIQQNESFKVARGDANESDDNGPVDPGKSSGKPADPKNDTSTILCTQVGGKAGALLYEGEEAKGFHLAAGTSYIYPTNFPIRQYQAAIVRSALFKNTLVSLPTGLGKTFIAAVVMYNFYRWFPLGKVVFMAPTRPLVAQQIKACYSIMGIPPDDTTEMTGIQTADAREKLWKEKRVFFLTPQVMANDLRSNTCPAELVKCLVIDEAHKAVKDYAYCQVVKSLSAANGIYRTLALSATPGNDINAVIQVIRNLNISCLEMRGEDSIDVAPYSHGKSVEQVVVDLSPELLRVKEDFLQILKAMEKFRANPPRGMSATLIGSLVSDFTMCMTFAHALELMQIYGLRAFYRYLSDEGGEKSKAATTRLRNNEDLQKLLKKLHDVLYPKPGSDVPYTWGHPKLKKLVTSLSDHFKATEAKGEKTKAIVFCNYKIVVNEIVDLLAQCKPHIQAALFVGQSGGKEKGMPQAKQLQIMSDFRNGKINCLVATCVAEEGLDIGEVDLIVLMESQKSPVRLVQRLGRTGRKRKGRCIVLLTRGKEESKFHEAMASRKSYVKNIVDSKAVKNSLCQYSPSMFPPDIKPQQQLVHVKVITAPTPTKPVKQSKKQMDIRECAVLEDRPFLEEEAAQKVIEELGGSSLLFNRMPSRKELWHRRTGPKMKVDELFESTNTLASWNDWNSEPHKSFVISSTTSSSLYCHLMSYSQEKEDQEYLKLVTDYENGIIPKTGGVNALRNDEKVNEEAQVKKPAKKKLVPKVNYGMDIRSCMAAALERAVKKPKFDLSDDDDVILVEKYDDEVVDDLQVDVERIDSEKGGSFIANTAEKLLVEKPRAVTKARTDDQFDVAAMFGMEGDDFDNLLYSGTLLCGLETDVDLCYRLGKFVGDSKLLAPKPKCMDADVFGFQCDQFLGLMDGVRDIPLRMLTALEPVDTHEAGVGSQPNNENDSFVGVDDLFGDDDCFQDVDQHITKSAMDKDELQNVVPRLNSPPSTNNNGFDNIGELSPIATKKNHTLSEAWGSSNSLFAGTFTPMSKVTSYSSKPIHCSTPINPNQKKRELFGAPDKQLCHEKEEWLLDDILEEEEKSKEGDKTHPIPDLPLDSSRDLFSSPPVGKVFQKSKVTFEVSAKPIPKAKDEDGFEEDFWCMDDLFGDDKPELHTNKDPKDDTTLYGITQMVSQIERDKRKNREVVEHCEVIEILDSRSCSPIQNVCSGSKNPSESSQKLEQKLINNSTTSITETPTNTNKLVSIQTGEKIPEKLEQKASSFKPVASHPIASTTTNKQSAVKSPVSIIDLDSDDSLQLDPQPGTSKVHAELPPKGAICNPKDTSCHSLLDEDDDIFNFLVSDDRILAGKNKDLSTNPKTNDALNFKKFKHKSSSLLSHFDSEPDNDFPPEKRNLNPDETIHLKVGSLSKRKLSFEEMLRELDDSTTSKYFASSTTVKNTCKSLSEKSSLKVSKVAMEVDEEDDIFVRPGQRKSVETEQSRNESSTASSSSNSPVKKVKKNKLKKKGHAFIEREAEESGILSSDDSDNSSLDQMDNSFVDDDSDQELSYAHYLKSVRSPVGRGKFKIPMNKQYLGNVYSQVVHDAEEDYENDSFCVDSNDEHSGNETTILEQAERKLSKRKHSKKRIVTPESEDSDVEDRVIDLESTVAIPPIKNKKKRRLLESDSDHTPERVPLKRTRNEILGDETISRSSTKNVISGENKLKNPSLARLESDSDEEFQEAIRRSVEETKAKTPEEKQFEEDLQKALLLSQVEVKGPSAFVRNSGGLHLKGGDASGNPGPSGLQSKPGTSNSAKRNDCGPSTSTRNASGLNSGRSDASGNPGPTGLLSKPGTSSYERGNPVRPSAGASSQNLPPPFPDDGGTAFLFMSQPILKDRPFSTKPKVTNPSGPKNKKCNRVFELSDDSN